MLARALETFTRIPFLLLFGFGILSSPPSGRGQTSPGCERVTLADPAAMQQLVNAHGQQEFAQPPELPAPPTSEANRLNLIVDYADLVVAGCPVHLRTYNNAIVGPTIRAKPGDTIHIRLINKLQPPAAPLPPHPQQPEPSGHGGMHGHPFSFNITNLHTHGLHVAPQGPVDPATGKVPFESDNVLVELGPGEQQDYRIHIHTDHPAGTFWYHAHVHGSTSVQLSSGMAGALIIEGGTAANGDLDTVPAIGHVKATEKIFLLQQLAYDQSGKVEQFSQAVGQRPTLINGQLVPVIRMRPGEVQRWRFIHAGVQENVALALDGHPIHEVAADGVTLDRVVPWAEAPASDARAANTLFLAPGYRTDVLVKARSPESGRKYFLRSLRLDPIVSVQAQERAFARADPTLESAPPVDAADFAPGQILAQILIEGDPVTNQNLPGPDDLRGMVPKDLPDITSGELVAGAEQAVTFARLRKVCNPLDGTCRDCDPGGADGSNCKIVFLVNDRQFAAHPDATRRLKLRTGGTWTAAEWKISTPSGFHPFHIHVNPFQVDRMEPNASGALVRRTVWKDTILVFGNDLPPLRTRYTRFKGKFVLHCHILQHEDQGMMQMVEIID